MKNLFKIIFILLSSFIFLYNAPLHADQTFTTIKKIYFTGLQRIPINSALSNLPFHIGSTVSEHDISHAIKMLFSTGYFETIKISQQKDTIIIKVKEYPLITNIVFYGTQTIKKNILIDNLKLYGIQEGKLLHQQNLFKVKQTLKNFFCDIGQYNTTIDIVTTHLPNNQVNLKIIFHENKSVQIQKINIIGNKKFSSKKLINLFQLHSRIPTFNIFFKKTYQNKILLNDLRTLRYFYLNRGFAKFNIDSTQINLTPDKKNIYLTIYITEGNQYRISNAIINGNLSEFSQKIHNLIRITPNELYNYKKINDSINSIKKLLEANGYIKPSIITEIKTNDIDNTLILYININIGRRFYVNKINFEGNIFTNDSVLRREIQHMEKTWINNNLIRQSKERLNRIGYFENVKIQYEYIPFSPDQLNILYKVKEHNSGSMNLNFGIGTESGINFQCGMQEENLFGTGNSFTLNTTKNNYQTYVELSGYHPYISVYNFNGGGKIFYNNFIADNANLSNYALKSHGITSSIGFPINEYNTLYFGLDYIHNNLSNIKPQVAIWRYLNSQNIHPKITPNPTINTKKFNDIYLSNNDLFFAINWKKNTLNHSYFPTHGSYINCSGKITIPGSNNEYYKIIINNNYYTPLRQHSNYWVIMGRIHAGYSAGLHNKENPFYDNFYSGGINTVRGFRPNTIGPKAAYYQCGIDDKTYNTCTIKNSQDAMGGNAIIILKGELIIPPPFLYKKHTNIIRTSIFIDLGTVWDNYWKNTIATRMANIPNYKIATNIRISNGLSIQWISPIGPVVFSCAKLIKKYTGDKAEQFQFNIGKTW